MTAPIGVLDSGVGGLTVLRALCAAMPGERFIYFGDTARAPYGGCLPETLFTYGCESIEFLSRRGAKAVVIACGSISSTVYERLTTAFDIPLLDVLRPGVPAVQALPAGTRALMLATQATVDSGFYLKLLRTRCPHIHLNALACPLFAPMAERGVLQGAETHAAIEKTLGHRRGQFDALVLGCTHYPLLTPAFRAVFPETQLVAPAAAVAAAAARRFREAGLLTAEGPQPTPQCEYHTSGDCTAFDRIRRKVMQG